MEESGRPFDHDCGPLVDKDFESKPIFHSELIDTDVNGFTDLDEPMESSSPEMEFRGSIAERRSAKFGFDASRINVAQFRICSSPSSSSPSCSPYLTIPPGISPAALLESPVMLPNSQSSPTTGTFPLASANHDSLTVQPVSPSTDDVEDSAIDSCAKFKSPGDPATQMPCVFSVENQAPQTSKSPAESGKEASVKSCDMSKSTKAVNMTRNATDLDMKPCNSNIADTQIPRFRECIKKETGAHHPLVDDQKATGLSTAGMTRNADDGYCWRKYGQKHVKGSEYPRSYYKCNNSNCPVKKKVERSHDGEITEIIYKGAHNHPKPQPRLSLGRQASSGELLETSDGIGSCPKLEGGAGWRYNQLSTKDFGANSDWRAYGMERTSSTSFLHDITDPISTSQGKSGSVFGSVENPELCYSIANEGEDEDGATQGSTSPGEDADGDESEPKRRKKEIFSAEAYLPSRSTREPRIILQIESEIDVLDDGYRWRKYGQKVVKGNPNPRSYYKCTSAGCPVRKHVERASEDIKSVITTYEGKHNHEVPTAKTNNGTASIGNSPPNVSDPHSILTLHRNPNVSNPEMQVQDLPLHYQMKPNDFSQANLLGDLVNDMKLGASSIYQMKFPPLQSPMSYGPFVMNSNGSETHTSCIAAPVMPEFPMAVPMSMPRSANVAVSGSFHSNNHSRINGLVQSSVGNQQMKETDLRFFKPKEEQKDDHLYDSCFATPPDNENETSSTVFCRDATGNFPS